MDVGRLGRRAQLGWGLLGAAAAAWFATWMLFFPQYVTDYFAWDVQPRFAQVFIGAGYIFRTAFFLMVAFGRDWFKLRWIVWGNLVFTGVLLFATYWHAGEFLWDPFQSPLAHLWIALYIFEPVVMLYLLPRGILGAAAPPTGGPLHAAFRPYLVFTTGLLLMFGLLLLFNPEFAAARWPWELNGLDARIATAWFLGWAAWVGTMAFADDWDEIRYASRLFVLNGVALTIGAIVVRGALIPERTSAVAFVVVVAAMTALMAVFHWVQERRRPSVPVVPATPAGTGWAEIPMGGSPDAERALIAGVMSRVEHIQDTVARKQAAEVRRAFHNKGTVVEIRFDVAAGVPAALQAGFLRPGASYRGFGRFSRSQSFRRNDGDLDQRGFAFRLETAEGAQDVLLSNTPASFARDPVQFLTVAAKFAESSRLVAPFRVLLAVGLGEGVRILRDILSAPPRDVAFTSQRYWSRTAFQIGDVAARLFVRPAAEGRRVARTDGPDFLSADLAAELRGGPRPFDLCAQLFVDEVRTPIEDTSRTWDEAVTPPVVLGTVTVVQQDLAAPRARELAARVETLEAFSPIVTSGMRPLGRMNRARVIAYARSADHRRAAAAT